MFVQVNRPKDQRNEVNCYWPTSVELFANRTNLRQSYSLGQFKRQLKARDLFGLWDHSAK